MDKNRETKKEKTYVCVVCKKTQKAQGNVKCCDQDMIAKEKGSWNA